MKDENLINVFSWLNTANDEIKTVWEYTKSLKDVEDKESLLEIIGDEFNHILIATLQAANALELGVPADGDLKELLDIVLLNTDKPGEIEDWPDVKVSN